LKDLQTFRLGQIQRDATLVAIAGEVISAQIAGERRSPTSCFIAGAGTLHLNDFRSQIAQDLTAERPGQYARGVENADSMKRAMRIGAHQRQCIGKNEMIIARRASEGPT